MRQKKITITHIKRWLNLLVGRSYYHQPQNIGRLFNANEIKGYFNDLTQKAIWYGEVDNVGIPINILVDGRKRVYFATTIVQKALGHYDKWLLSKETKHFDQFIKLCDWLVDNQDDRGGWRVWEALHVSSASPYSAMTLGEVISAMVRALKHTNRKKYDMCAKRAYDLLILPVEHDGTSVYHKKFLFLEEVPQISRNTILNGWIFALFGLYEYYLTYKSPDAYHLFRHTLETLEQYIETYDSGFWSYYDTKGTLASHIYHNLHIAQLQAILCIDPALVNIGVYLEKWQRYQKRKFNQYYAIAVKGIQKMQNPGEGTLLK